jgi:hypothetical protein
LKASARTIANNSEYFESSGSSPGRRIDLKVTNKAGLEISCREFKAIEENSVKKKQQVKCVLLNKAITS